MTNLQRAHYIDCVSEERGGGELSRGVGISHCFELLSSGAVCGTLFLTIVETVNDDAVLASLSFWWSCFGRT